MKKLLFLLMFTVILYACKKDDDQTANPLGQLPTATQTGENTFGCLVNGEPLKVINSNNIYAIFQQGQLQFGAVNENGNLDQSVDLILGDPLMENVEYEFTNPSGFYNPRYSIFLNGIEECIYNFENTYSGKIIFTKIDRTNYIISGTFEFSTVADNCETITITNGRFDLQYIP